MDDLILDDQFYIELESLRIKLFGQSIHDPESNSTINIPGLNKNDYMELFEYDDIVSKIYFRLKDSYDKLIVSLNFLKLFNSANLKENGIGKSQYLSQHLEYWHIKIATAFELGVKLTGVVYDLRISDKFINLRIVENNKYIKANTYVISLLKQLRILVESNIRNEIVHDQIFNNDFLDEMSLVDLLDLFNLAIPIGDEVEINMNVEILIEKYYSKSVKFTETLNFLSNSLVLVFKDFCIKKEFGNKR